MNDFWFGTFAGALASLVLFIVTAFIVNTRVNELQLQMNELKEQHAIQQQWIEENETVMQTYKFFNESWAAIIKLQEEKEKDNAQCK